MRLTIDPVAAQRLRYENGVVEIAKGELGGVALELPGLGMRISAEQAVLSGGGLFEPGKSLRLPILSVPEARVVIDDVVALFRSDGDTPPDASKSSGTSTAGEPFDFRFLDRLNGHLNVDLDLDIKIPLLGRRRGKHQFRVPIEGGVINYRKLERNLSALEDAVIDVEARGDRLAVERDIPLLPMSRQEIIGWPLDPEGQELAQKKLVRLRTLLNWQLPGSDDEKRDEKRDEDDDEEKDRIIPAVAAREVDIMLSLGGGDRIPVAGGWLRLGDAETAAVGELRLRGEAHYEGGHDLPPTHVSPVVRNLRLGLDQLHLGSARLRADLFAGSLEDVTVIFRAFVPTRLEGTVRDLRLLDVAVDFT